jgi:hypothetical protein
MVVRGVCFQGDAFDSFEPQSGSDPASQSSFEFSHGFLSFCTLEADIPLPIVTPAGIADGLLTFKLTLDKVAPELLKMVLVVGERTCSSRGQSGWFEDEMLDLQRQLPDGTFIKACINCAFSDYSPYGQGMSGSLACFRGNKAGYRAVTGKKDLFEIWDTLTGFVQETHICPEFERRTPGTGYRG